MSIYCNKCDGTVVIEETIEESLGIDERTCPHCGEPLPTFNTLEDVVLTLIERIEKLEELIRCLHGESR